jgi:fructan beta-fructosidase
MKNLIRAAVLLLSIGLFSHVFAADQNSREMKIAKKYLNLPVNNSDAKVWCEIVVDGKVVRGFDVQLAAENPDYWVFADVSEFVGKSIVLSVKDGHPALENVYQDDRFWGQDSLYSEKYRPQFHFSSRRGWNNDPNGLVFYDGEYHLFYQHNPYSTGWGNMHWAHAVSNDLVHWKELPLALFPDEFGTMFSGSAVVDWNNTSGFQTGKEKVLVAAYTAHKNVPNSAVETQCIAYSNDRGRTWMKYENNPVIGDQRPIWNSANIRDPKVFWYEPGKHWVMALFESIGISVYTSDNLKEWTFQSHTEGFWECPELFELPVDGDPKNKKWVMYGASGSYAIGDFDGNKFTWESGKHWYNHGAMYAAQSYNDIPTSDGRRIQIGWGRIQSPGMPFNQMMLFPTELSLRTTSNGVRLFCEPAREIELLHGKKYEWKNISRQEINKELEKVTGDLLHIRCEIESKTAHSFGLEIHGNQLMYELNRNTFNGFPFALQPNKNTLYFDVLVDKTSIETFLDHGALYSATARNLKNETKGIQFFRKGSWDEILIKSCEIFELKSIWK